MLLLMTKDSILMSHKEGADELQNKNNDCYHEKDMLTNCFKDWSEKCINLVSNFNVISTQGHHCKMMPQLNHSVHKNS